MTDLFLQCCPGGGCCPPCSPPGCDCGCVPCMVCGALVFLVGAVIGYVFGYLKAE